MQWPHKHFSCAFICIICTKYAKICKIRKHESYMQHMQKYALPTLPMFSQPLEIHASMNLLFQINTRKLFCPFGYSSLSVVSSTAWYVLLWYALCGKTVLERFQFRYFRGQSSHHQAYAVTIDSDGISAFKFRVSLWSLSVSCHCDLSPAWNNSHNLSNLVVVEFREANNKSSFYH